MPLLASRRLLSVVGNFFQRPVPPRGGGGGSGDGAGRVRRCPRGWGCWDWCSPASAAVSATFSFPRRGGGERGGAGKPEPLRGRGLRESWGKLRAGSRREKNGAAAGPRRQREDRYSRGPRPPPGCPQPLCGAVCSAGGAAPGAVGKFVRRRSERHFPPRCVPRCLRAVAVILGAARGRRCPWGALSSPRAAGLRRFPFAR